MAARPTRIRRAALPYAISPGTWKPEQMAELAYQIQEDLQFIYEQVQIKGLPKNPSTGDLLVALSPAGFSLFPIDPVLQRVLTNEGIGSAGGAVPQWGQVSLSSGVKGNLPVGHLDNGTGANAGTVWRGDGHWGEPQYPLGMRGIPGLDGDDGESSFVPGPPGPSVTGSPGAPGPAGPAGIGMSGLDGEDGVESFIPGPPGPVATGTPGATGSAGPAGVGMSGVDGDPGEDSFVPGMPGQPGAQGAAGSTGTSGGIGPPGLDGADADDPWPGLPGATGSSVIGQPMGARVAKSAGVIYQADADGFFVVEYRSTTDDDVVDVSLLADTFSPPTTERGGLSINAGVIGITAESTTIPIRSGEYYTATVNVTAGAPTALLYFVAGGGAGPTGPAGAAGASSAGGAAMPFFPEEQETTDPGWPTGAPASVGGGSYDQTILTCTGHPQGQVSAPVGLLCIDLTSGKLYQKVGGGTTAYGWYYLAPNSGAGLGGPIVSAFWPTGTATGTTVFSRTQGYGYWGASGTDAEPFTTTSPSAQRTTVSGHVFAQSVTGAVSGNSTYFTSNATNTLLVCDDDFDLFIEMRTGADVTNVRYWFGISSAAISDTDALGVTNGAILFRYSTVAGDGGWVGYTAAAGASTVSGTVNAIAASTTYRLRIRFDRANNKVWFSVNDGTEVGKTTNIPAAGSTPLFLLFGCMTKTTAAKTIMYRSIGAVMGS